MRGNHRIWGRDDYVEPAGLTPEQKAVIAQLTVYPTPERRTCFNVEKGGKFIGQVRTTFGGQMYRRSPEDEFFYAAFKWNSTDPQHGHALLALMEAPSLS